MFALAVALSWLQSSDSALDQVISKFKDHQIVAFAERHRSKPCHEFLRALIASPSFPADDIVVEFGNPLYQETADRYVAGKNVNPSQLAKIWRNTTQWLVWDSSLYPQFLAAVRRANQGRQKKIRVILGDSPIDWAKVHNPEDYRPFATRDDFYFAQVDRLFKRGHKVLVVVGGMHLPKRDLRSRHREKMPDLADRYGKAIFTIWTLAGQSTLGDALRPPSYPWYTDVADSGLAQASVKLMLPPKLRFFRMVKGQPLFYEPDELKMPTMGECFDGFLALSPRETLVLAPPGTYQDKAYVRELMRRAKILEAVFGMPFRPELDQLLKEGG